MSTKPPGTYGPNSASVEDVLAHASAMLTSETRSLGLAMTASWSYGETDGRFPPFVAALGAACHVAVSSGRLRAFRAARAAVHTPRESWDHSAPVALVGLRVTVAALVVADLLTADQLDVLLGPWQTLERQRPASVRGAA